MYLSVSFAIDVAVLIRFVADVVASRPYLAFPLLLLLVLSLVFLLLVVVK